MYISLTHSGEFLTKCSLDMFAPCKIKTFRNQH